MTIFYLIYYVFCSLTIVLLLPLVIDRDFRRVKYNRLYDTFLVVFISCFSIFLFGSRGYDVGTDTPNYVSAYKYLLNAKSFKEALNLNFLNKDPFFNVFTYFWASILPLRGYFYILAIFYVTPLSVASFALVKRYRSLLMFGFLCLISFVSLGINIVRSGLSLSFVVLAVVYFINGKQIKGIFYIVIATLFHLSAILVVVALIVSRRIKVPLLIYYGVFTFCVYLAYLDKGLKDLPIIGPLIIQNERIENYASGNGEQIASGLHIYTFFFQVSVIVITHFFAKKIDDIKYNNIRNTFIILSGVYFLCLNMNFSDRFGILSWTFIPILLCYPFVNYNNYKKYQLTMLMGLLLFYGLLGFYRIMASL